jgi:hypothetical protein
VGFIVFAAVMIGAAVMLPRNIAAVDGANKTLAVQQLNTKAIDQIIGRSGELKGDVYKIGLPRTDLKVTADGEPIKPGLALGSWMAFKRTGDHAMVMGDLVLLESEITPVLSKLEDSGIEISAIHNHVLNRHMQAEEETDRIAESYQRKHRRELELATNAIEAFQDRFRLPQMEEAARLLTQFRENSPSEMLARYFAQESSLRQAIESTRTPWLDIHEAMKSMGGFGKIQGIGHALRTIPAFGRSSSWRRARATTSLCRAGMFPCRTRAP